MPKLTAVVVTDAASTVSLSTPGCDVPRSAPQRAAWHHAPLRRTLVAAMSDITLILRQIDDGDPSAAMSA
mgnify:FL=1